MMENNIKVNNKNLHSETIKILNELIELNIPAVTAFKLAKITKELDAIVNIRNERELSLIKKYCKRDDDDKIIEGKDTDGNTIPNTFEIIDGQAEDYNKEMTDFLEYTNELTGPQIPIEDFKLITFSTKKLMKIDFLFYLEAGS